MFLFVFLLKLVYNSLYFYVRMCSVCGLCVCVQEHASEGVCLRFFVFLDECRCEDMYLYSNAYPCECVIMCLSVSMYLSVFTFVRL